MQIVPKGDRAYAPPEFGIEANALKTIRVPLDNARDLAAFEIGGTCLWAQAASDLTAQVDVRFNDQLRDPMTISQGFFIRGVPFSRLYISNAAQTGKWITLFYTVEDDTVQVVNPSQQFKEVDITKPTVLESVADVVLAATVTTQILAANTARRLAIMRNLSANTQTLRIGDNNAGATRGIPLDPGDSIALETTEAIHGYNPGAGAENVAVIWTED